MPLGNVIVLHYYITLYRCVNKISIVERERERERERGGVGATTVTDRRPAALPLGPGAPTSQLTIFFTLLYHIDVVIIVFV